MWHVSKLCIILYLHPHPHPHNTDNILRGKNKQTHGLCDFNFPILVLSPFLQLRCGGDVTMLLTHTVKHSLICSGGECSTSQHLTGFINACTHSSSTPPSIIPGGWRLLFLGENLMVKRLNGFSKAHKLEWIWGQAAKAMCETVF